MSCVESVAKAVDLCFKIYRYILSLFCQKRGASPSSAGKADVKRGHSSRPLFLQGTSAWSKKVCECWKRAAIRLSRRFKGSELKPAFPPGPVRPLTEKAQTSTLHSALRGSVDFCGGDGRVYGPLGRPRLPSQNDVLSTWM